MKTEAPILRIATRGSALALVQANSVLAQCRQAFAGERFELSIIKTTGDKLQKASMANPDVSLPKGLFTKELEVALLRREADLAVHSLKDLPTDVPDGLQLGAVGQRADARDVMICRAADFPVGQVRVADLPRGATVATSSTRRKAQLLAHRPDLQIVEIRGNVGTRLKKLATQPSLAATLLAAAGLERLGFRIDAGGRLAGEGTPPGLCASPLSFDEMLPCVGQAAIGIEVRRDDSLTERICQALNHAITWACITAERAFLHAMGGGCQSPVAALAEASGSRLHLRAASFHGGREKRGERRGTLAEAGQLGEDLARELKP